VSRKVIRWSRHWLWLWWLLWKWRQELLFVPKQQSVTIIGDDGYRFFRHRRRLATGGLRGCLATDFDAATASRKRHFYPVRGTTTTWHVGYARVCWSRPGQTACHHCRWLPDNRRVQCGRGTMPAAPYAIHVRNDRKIVVGGTRTVRRLCRW